MKRILRNEENKQLNGVLSGFAAYHSIDVTLLRLAFMFVVLIGFFFISSVFWICIISYVVCAVVIPKDIDEERFDSDEDK